MGAVTPAYNEKFPWSFPFNAYILSLAKKIRENASSLWQEVLLSPSLNIYNLVWSLMQY